MHIENNRLYGNQALGDADFIQARVMGASRGYRFKVYDAMNRVAFVISRPLQYCKSGCCASIDCCKRQSTVEGAGEVFGRVRTDQACCNTSLTIADANYQDIMNIDGPLYCARFCSDTDFPLTSVSNGSTMGRIRRKYLGYVQANYSKADVFEIEFPVDLSVRMKAAVIGACIMIDFLEFEFNNKDYHRRRRHL